MPGKIVVIKKYENRRLYDSTNSRYVNLEDIAQMVRDGVDVQVVDASTGEDLTRVVLTQIVAEKAKGPDSVFPIDVLRQMVIASGQVGRDGMLGYMKAMSEMYQNTFKAFAGSRLPFAAPANTPGASGEPSVDELRRRVEELERTVTAKKTSPRKTNSKKKK